MNGSSQKGILVVIGVVVAAGVIGAAVAQESTVQILGFCSLIAVALLGLLQQMRTADQAETTAKKVEDVKIALGVSDRKASDDVAKSDAKQDKIIKTGEITKSLANSSYGASLWATLQALRAVERLTSDPASLIEAKAAVVEAERLHNEHIAKQAVVDAKDAKDVKDAAKADNDARSTPVTGGKLDAIAKTTEEIAETTEKTHALVSDAKDAKFKG